MTRITALLQTRVEKRELKLFSTVWASQDRVNIADLLMMHGVPER